MFILKRKSGRWGCGIVWRILLLLAGRSVRLAGITRTSQRGWTAPLCTGQRFLILLRDYRVFDAKGAAVLGER